MMMYNIRLDSFQASHLAEFCRQVSGNGVIRDLFMNIYNQISDPEIETFCNDFEDSYWADIAFNRVDSSTLSHAISRFQKDDFKIGDMIRVELKNDVEETEAQRIDIILIDKKTPTLWTGLRFENKKSKQIEFNPSQIIHETPEDNDEHIKA